MAFICEECHKNYDDWHPWPTSYGPCEDCHKTRGCYDCRGTHVEMLVVKPVINEPASTKIKSVEEEQPLSAGAKWLTPEQLANDLAARNGAYHEEKAALLKFVEGATTQLTQEREQRERLEGELAFHISAGQDLFALKEDAEDRTEAVLTELATLRGALEEAQTLFFCEWAIPCERMRTEFGKPDHPNCRACAWLKKAAALTPSALKEETT